MRRRDFITLLGGAAVAWPLAAHAQQPERMRSIGVLKGPAADDSESTARSRRRWGSWAGPMVATCESTIAGLRPILTAFTPTRPNSAL